MIMSTFIISICQMQIKHLSRIVHQLFTELIMGLSLPQSIQRVYSLKRCLKMLTMNVGKTMDMD